MLANFPKKSLFGLGTILRKNMQPYSRDLLCGNVFEMTWHDGKDSGIVRPKQCWSTFVKNSFLRK